MPQLRDIDMRKSNLRASWKDEVNECTFREKNTNTNSQTRNQNLFSREIISSLTA